MFLKYFLQKKNKQLNVGDFELPTLCGNYLIGFSGVFYDVANSQNSLQKKIKKRTYKILIQAKSYNK